MLIFTWVGQSVSQTSMVPATFIMSESSSIQCKLLLSCYDRTMIVTLSLDRLFRIKVVSTVLISQTYGK